MKSNTLRSTRLNSPEVDQERDVQVISDHKVIDPMLLL